VSLTKSGNSFVLGYDCNDFWQYSYQTGRLWMQWRGAVTFSSRWRLEMTQARIFGYTLGAENGGEVLVRTTDDF
jgi:hypothetical protein